MSGQSRFNWLSHQAFLHRRPAARRRVDFPTRRPLRFELLEDRLALATLTVTSLADGHVNLSDSVVTLRDAIHAAN